MEDDGGAVPEDDMDGGGRLLFLIHCDERRLGRPQWSIATSAASEGHHPAAKTSPSATIIQQ